MTYSVKSHAVAFAAGVLIMFFWPTSNAELVREKAKLQQIEAQYRAEREEHVEKMKQYEAQIAVLTVKKNSAETSAEIWEDKANDWRAIADRNEMKAQNAAGLDAKLQDTQAALDARGNEAETLRAALANEREAVTWLTRISLKQAEQIEEQQAQIVRMEHTIEQYQQSNAELIRLCERQRRPRGWVPAATFAVGVILGVVL